MKFETLHKEDWGRVTLNKGIINSIIDQDSVLRKASIISITTNRIPSLAAAVMVRLKKDNIQYACKISRCENLPFLKREQLHLDKLNLIGLKHSYLLPEIVSRGSLKGFDYSVFPYYSGYHLAGMNRIQRKIVAYFVKGRLSVEIKDFLLEMALKTKQVNKLPFGDYTEKPVLDFLQTKSGEQVEEISRKYLEVLRKEWQSVPLVFEHCDLLIINIIFESIIRLKFKIIDWESMQEEGFPALDLIRLCLSLHIDNKIMKSFVKDYCSRLDFNADSIPALRFLRLIKSREKMILENQLHLTAEWKKKEKRLLSKICQFNNIRL